MGAEMRHLGLRNSVNVWIFKLRNARKETFECPICGYRGPFMDKVTHNGIRKHARCPNCSALGRHCLQFLVLQTVLRDKQTDQLKMLHVAIEAFFREFFRSVLVHMKLPT